MNKRKLKDNILISLLKLGYTEYEVSKMTIKEELRIVKNNIKNPNILQL